MVDVELILECYYEHTKIKNTDMLGCYWGNDITILEGTFEMEKTADNKWKKLGGFIKKHKKAVIGVTALLLVAVVVIEMLGSATPAAGNMALPQTITLQKMDLEQMVSGTGTLQSSNTRYVTSSLTYEIEEIYVQEGDVVEEGTLLALIDSTEIDKSIAETRKSISDAQKSDKLALEQAQRKLQDAITTRDINWAKNEAAVVEAQNALNTANSNVTSARTAKDNAANALFGMIKNGLNSAENIYNASVVPPDPTFQYPSDDTIRAITSLDTAQKLRDGGQLSSEAYNAIVADGSLMIYFSDYATAQQALTSAETALSAAQTTYNNAVQTRDTTYRNDSLSVESAQDSVNSLKIKDSAASYKTQLTTYLENKEKCKVVAPIAGTVTSMTAKVGSSAGGAVSAAAGTGTSSSSSALFTIEDENKLEISTSIPEYDAVSLKTGMQTKITSDAITGEEWLGKVKSISPKATDDSGNFTVVIEVTSDVGKLAIGMSSKVNIVTESKTNVYAVPYDAVATNAAGESVVYVWTESNTPQSETPTSSIDNATTPDGTAIVVQTGMETDYYIEISGAGLEDGLLILADPENKNVASGSGNAGGFFMGGGV